MEMAYQITAYERPQRLAARTIKAVMDVQSNETFDPVPGGTRMRWVWEVEPHGVLKLLAPLVPYMMGRRLDTVLANIKHLLEAQESCRRVPKAGLHLPQTRARRIENE